MKRIVIILLVLFFLPFNYISAYASTPTENIEIRSLNVPDNAAYIDLLIMMDSNDESYTEFNSNNMARFQFDSKELSNYNEDGYISMSCHYNNNYTDMELLHNEWTEGIVSWNCFAVDEYPEGHFINNSDTMKDLVTKKRKFKIAIINKNGKILQVSDSFDIVKDSKLFLDRIEYDVSNNVVHMEWDEKPFKISFTVNRDKEAIIMISILGLIVFLLVIASIILIVKRIKKHCKK